MGAEIGGHKGKATAMPATVQERLIRIWANPQGAAKSALAGTMTEWRLGANPSTVIPDGVMKAGNTTLSWDAAGKPVFTFPIPGVEGATGTATLDAEVPGREGRGHAGREHHRVHLQQLSGLEQPAAQDRGVLRRPVDRDGRTARWSAI